MKSLTSVAALLVLALATLSVDAFTDFHAMNPHHKRTELPDGRVHLSHDVHHVFAEHGSFFKAKYEAIHDKKWHFVELHHHSDHMSQVSCGAGSHELYVKSPSSALKAELSKQNYEHTVLTSHHKNHCGEEAIFRLVTGTTYNAESDHLQIHTVQANYHDVFEYLNYDQDTDHLEQNVIEEPSEDGVTDAMSGDELPEPEAEQAMVEADSETVQERQMQQQFFKKLWKKVKKAVKKVVKVVKKVVKKAVKIVTAPIRIVKALVTGTWEKDWHKKLAALKWNGAVNKKFSKWQFTGDAKFAASAAAGAGLRFRLLIKGYRLRLIEAYYYGYFNGGIRASFNAKVKYDLSKTKQVARISVATITFAIGPVPVVIKIDAPITVGFDLNIDGRISLNFLLYVDGSIKQGIRYTNTKGFEAINEKHFKKQRDFNPRIFKYEITLVPWAQVMFVANVNFLGGVQVGVRVGGEAILKNSYRCHLLLQINLQPVILAGAQIDIRIGSLKIYQKNWGPKSLVSWKIPLVNFCLPKKRRGRRNEHQFLLAAADSANDGTLPINNEPVEIVHETELGANETGTNWFGKSSCFRPNLGQTELHFSLQFLAENETTQVVVTVMQNVTTDSSTAVDPDSTLANYTYQQTNIQQTYEVNEILAVGSDVIMTHVNEPDPDDQYQANTTEAVLGNISSSFRLTVGAADINDITVHSESMFCGSVKLTTESFNDDNATFTIFASGESTAEEDDTLLDKLKAYVIYVPIICVVIVAVVVVVVLVSKKRRAAAHGASWAKVEQDFTAGPHTSHQGLNDNDARVAAL